MFKVARGDAGGELKAFVAQTQVLESTLKTEFPKLMEASIEAITNMHKTITIDSDNVKLRIRQTLGDSDKVRQCIEKHREDITKYVNTLSAANKKCMDTGLTQLRTIKETGKVNVFTPFHEFNTKLNKDATKCIAEIKKDPQCDKQILSQGKARFAEIEKKAQGLFEKTAGVQMKTVECFQVHNNPFTGEFESLNNVVKKCSK